MRIGIRAAIVLLSVAVAMAAIGCTHSDDSSLSSARTDPKHGEQIGYYEVPHEDVIYVLGSIQSRDALRNGKVPPTTRSGFSTQGQSVLFETDHAGLAERLMAEYDRRHRFAR
jgi:hypothetical protein